MFNVGFVTVFGNRGTFFCKLIYNIVVKKVFRCEFLPSICELIYMRERANTVNVCISSSEVREHGMMSTESDVSRRWKAMFPV
jgi:hypothetical protein